MNFTVSYLVLLISLGTCGACLPPHEDQEKSLSESPKQEKPASVQLYYDYPGYSSPVYYRDPEFNAVTRVTAMHRQLIPGCSLQK